MAKELLSRDQVDVANTWNLSDMYADNDLWKADVDAISEIAEKISAMEGKLSESATNLYDALKLMEELCIKLSRVGNYAMCLANEDTGNTEHQAMEARSDAAYAGALEKIAFLDPELLTIEDEKYAQFYNDLPKLCKYKHYIDESLRLREYTLSTQMERLMALSQETRDASIA